MPIMKMLLCSLLVTMLVGVWPCKAAEQHIGLRELLENVAAEISAAAEDRIKRGMEPRFKLDSVELEINFVASKAVEGNGSVKFWVVNAGSKAEFTTQSVQKIKIRMHPIDYSTLTSGDRDKLMDPRSVAYPTAAPRNESKSSFGIQYLPEKK